MQQRFSTYWWWWWWGEWWGVGPRPSLLGRIKFLIGGRSGYKKGLGTEGDERDGDEEVDRETITF